MTKENIKARLEYFRGEIKTERISYSEIAELQSYAKYIDKNDVLLLEWAGVDENGHDEFCNSGIGLECDCYKTIDGSKSLRKREKIQKENKYE